MSNLIKRTVPVILVLVICITCLVSPVSAASDISSDVFIELLDYGYSAETGKNYAYLAGYTFRQMTYSLPNRLSLGYVDVLFYNETGQDMSVSVYNNNSLKASLKVMHIDGNLYRAVGSFDPFLAFDVSLRFSVPSASNGSVSIESFKVGRFSNSYVPMTGKVNIDNGAGDVSGTWSAGSSLTLTLPSAGENYSSSFVCNIIPYKWELYDYISLSFMYYGDAPDYLSAYCGDNPVPFSYDYIHDDEDHTYRYITVYLDLSSIDRQYGLDGTPVVFSFRGSYHYTSSSFQLICCHGFVDFSEPSHFALLMSNLKGWFQTLFDKFDAAFGLNDDSSSAAQQTQEEINVSVNNQLVGAVEDWNTHIEVVETGYDSALTKATPALSWLASLADRIFSNMGWFGNIYFLIGLISVIMLVLSKSGLARSVGRIRRNE